MVLKSIFVRLLGPFYKPSIHNFLIPKIIRFSRILSHSFTVFRVNFYTFRPRDATGLIAVISVLPISTGGSLVFHSTDEYGRNTSVRLFLRSSFWVSKNS